MCSFRMGIYQTVYAVVSTSGRPLQIGLFMLTTVRQWPYPILFLHTPLPRGPLGQTVYAVVKYVRPTSTNRPVYAGQRYVSGHPHPQPSCWSKKRPFF